MQGLSKAWAPVFAEKHINFSTAKQYLRKFPPSYPWAQCKPPDSKNIEAFLKHAPDSASGPDGLPYRAWKAAGPEGVETLDGVLELAMDGVLYSVSFNDSAMLFPAKGQLDGDHMEVVREAVDTRPLSLKNSDNKTITACINHASIHTVAQGTHHSQRGFVPGRQLLQNVVDLDYHARHVGLMVHGHNAAAVPTIGLDSPLFRLALLAFFDFATAFPSVAHAWLFLVVQFSNPPKWFHNFIKVLYSINSTYSMDVEGKHFMFYIWSGVLQGCPLSATLFLMCINPFLIHFESSLNRVDGGIVRACADDIGASISRLVHLKKLFIVFEFAKSVSNMHLKPKKCNIIPTNIPCTEQVVAHIKAWLLQHIPEWANFKVVPQAIYLGFHLGPAIAHVQWASTINKWTDRTKHIASTGVGPSLGIFAYNFTALPVLGYRAQLLPPPRGINIKEIHLLHHLLHLPPNTFDLNLFFQFEQFGGSSIKSAITYCTSCIFRASFAMIRGWKSQLDTLRADQINYLPAALWTSPTLAPPFWDTPPFVYNLSIALSGELPSLNVAPLVPPPPGGDHSRQFPQTPRPKNGLPRLPPRPAIYPMVQFCATQAEHPH